MKKFPRQFRLALISCLIAGPLFGQEKPPAGTLGLPLGTFAIIEGTEHRTGKLVGSKDFFLETINGKKPAHELRIQTSWPTELPEKRTAGKRYVLHGYEAGAWGGSPIGLPPQTQGGLTQCGAFYFEPTFVVTSVEKIDGVTVSDAKPLDPKVPLAKPGFDDESIDGPTRLELPMGTVATIEVHSPMQPRTKESPFQIDSVNGNPLDHAEYISIPGVAETSDEKHITLRGYETGEWGGMPVLPRSEYSGPMPQAGFQYFAKFVVVPTS